ncbi:hypothetical protein Nmel_005493 [Mimus melanotis]
MGKMNAAGSCRRGEAKKHARSGKALRADSALSSRSLRLGQSPERGLSGAWSPGQQMSGPQGPARCQVSALQALEAGWGEGLQMEKRTFHAFLSVIPELAAVIPAKITTKQNRSCVRQNPAAFCHQNYARGQKLTEGSVWSGGRLSPEAARVESALRSETPTPGPERVCHRGAGPGFPLRPACRLPVP